MKLLRSNYSVVSVIPDTVFIVDLNGPRSVTNEAERVVEELLRTYGNRKIVYRDSDGRWDELKHDGKEFVGFGPAAGPSEPLEFDLKPFSPEEIFYCPFCGTPEGECGCSEYGNFSLTNPKNTVNLLQ